ncbi:hypothetical protein FOMPIDRAFT_1149250 [Fomitopsis schrenkii]|uniref:PHD-type domain-containing protein n=1 Tax=Fomitopsis schrenkii TaxID=2126942 RepID=S8FI39_FOMSC|nr:hypothetical protein FOMPIDRAFT_1149250 [Fomitopsis schrenkii]
MNALTDSLTLSPPRSREITPASSNLGSPFGGHRLPNDRSPSKVKTPARSQAATPTAAPLIPAPSQDNVSAATPSQTPPPLSAPIPQRPLGGEIERIKAQMAVDQAVRATETEARRPDYLVRAQRPGSGQIIEPLIEEPDGNPVLGVTVTPMRGRRIQLFQETSEESFEQSLLAGGYPGYGSMATEPQTPIPSKPSGNISQRMLQWFSQATPGQPGPSNVPTEPEEDWVPSEKEIRKRKRLAAFEEEKDPNDHNTRLHPVEVANKGRILITVPPEDLPPEISATLQTPTKKRPPPRRRRRGHRRGRGGSPGDEDELDGPNWIDGSFPWCTRLQERKDLLRMAKEERLRWIESYFDGDSDLTNSEDEGMRHSDQSLQPAANAHDDDEVHPIRRGRGKMVPLNRNPEAREPDARARKNLLIPSDPADARAALLSKRSVRALAERRRRREEDEESSDEVNCPCGRGENGKPCVQCDDCKCWFHLRCMGIRSETELGADDDPWYCPECLGVVSSDPLSEPTFVPTDNELPRDGVRDPLLYQGSPRTPYSVSRRDPKTPTQTRERSEVYDSRSSWNSSGAGPVTPLSSQRDVAVYKTPTFDSPFNPADTPSRGKFNFSSPWADDERWHLTPKDWKSGGFHDIAFDRRVALPGYSRGSAFDDTPVLRNMGREDISMVGRRLWASPTSPAPSFRRSSLQGRTDPSTPGAKAP